MNRQTCLFNVLVLMLTLVGVSQSALAAPILYTTNLDGSLSGSPGTGYSEITIDDQANTLLVHITFSGLQGPTTAAHIQGPTAIAGSGNAGVITETPYFAGFPIGVASGTYDHTFDLTLASSFNPSFITANGGTAASAETALAASLADGTAYLNIHTAVFPGGEIRGFLQPGSSPSVPEPSTFLLLGVGLGGWHYFEGANNYHLPKEADMRRAKVWRWRSDCVYRGMVMSVFEFSAFWIPYLNLCKEEYKMNTMYRRTCRCLLALAGLLMMAVIPFLSPPATAATLFDQINLVTNNQAANPAQITDPNLVNPWGISISSTSPFWVSDNGTGVTTLYNVNPITNATSKIGLEVTIPGAGNPTGQVFNTNNSTSFNRDLFLFVSEDGTISGWRGALGTTAETLQVGFDANVYKGATEATISGNSYLYAANFRSGRIDVLKGTAATPDLAGNFTDPNTPAGYAPFNIQNLGDKLYVTYAMQDANKLDDVAGAGHGIVSVFDTQGNLLGRVGTGELSTLRGDWRSLRDLLANSQVICWSAILVTDVSTHSISLLIPSKGNFWGSMPANSLLTASGD